MIEYTLVCDGCSRIIDANRSVKSVRKNAIDQKNLFIKNGKDYCWDCHGKSVQPSEKGA